MTQQLLVRYMEEKKVLVDRYLDELIPIDTKIPVINEAMRYSLFAGGKRLRPILTIMACELLDGSLTEALPFASCIEMIHTYSLIHDDLPAMDNDDFRRGKPTNHKIYGEGYAVLAGDALLNTAFEILFDILSKKPDEKNIKAADTISKASGTKGMIGGQCIDIFYEDKRIDTETLISMHEKKTGALISAALLTGVILAEGSQQDYERISHYGKSIGLAFQIVDDILDVEGSLEKLGKKTGSDQNKNKATFVTLNGLDRSKEIAKNLIEEAKSSILPYGDKGNLLRELADFILHRDK